MDADVAATFKELGAKFKLDDKVIDHLVKTEKMESLEEFSRSATSEQEVGDIIKNITGLENLLQQTSRLRMAWTAIRAATEKSVVIKKRDGEADDLDKLLPQGDLDDLHELFWNRHRLTYEPDDETADGLISRLHREIYRRLLTVRDVWATKCLIHQVKSEKKRTQLAEGLDLVHTEMAVELPCKHNVVNFLHLHAAMMLAYAKAGIKRRPDAPQQEPRGADPCLFVECPYDILLKYHRRIQARVHKLADLNQPPLEWVMNRDIAEREVWVRDFRNSKLSLGTVIAQAYEKREALWQIDEETIKEKVRERMQVAALRQQEQKRMHDRGGATRSPRRVRSPDRRGKGGKEGKGGKGKKGDANGNGIRGSSAPLTSFRNGEKLCAAFQQGRCQEPCPDGALHKCGRPMQNTPERACGSTRHGAARCDNPRRVR